MTLAERIKDSWDTDECTPTTYTIKTRVILPKSIDSAIELTFTDGSTLVIACPEEVYLGIMK